MVGDEEGHSLHFEGVFRGTLIDQHSFQIHLAIWWVSFTAAFYHLLSQTLAFWSDWPKKKQKKMAPISWNI